MTRILITLLLAAALSSAQGVFRVGSTRQYQQIQDAINAIQVGPGIGTILVDPGTYNRFSVVGPYAIRIHSANGTRYDVNPGAGPNGNAAYIRVTNPNSHCVITGMRTAAVANAPAVFIDRSVGTVCLVGSSGDHGVIGSLPVLMANATTPAVVRIDQSPRVYLEGVTIEPQAGVNFAFQANTLAPVDAVLIEDSTVVVNRCRLRGFDNFEGQGGNGITATMSSTVWVDDTWLQGGNGFFFGGHGIQISGGVLNFWPQPPQWTGGTGSQGIGLPSVTPGTQVQPAQSPTVRIDTTPQQSVRLGTTLTGVIDFGIPRSTFYTLWLGYTPYFDASLPWTEGQPGLMDLTGLMAPPGPTPLFSGQQTPTSSTIVPFSFPVPNDPTLLGAITVLQVLHTTASPGSGVTWSEPQILHFWN